MALRKIVKSDAIYKVFEARDNKYDAYRPNDQLYIDGWYFTFGDVFSAALRNGQCPLEGLARAEKSGHEVYWLSRNSVVLGAAKNDERQVAFAAKIGDTIKYAGKLFTITENNILSSSSRKYLKLVRA